MPRKRSTSLKKLKVISLGSGLALLATYLFLSDPVSDPRLVYDRRSQVPPSYSSRPNVRSHDEQNDSRTPASDQDSNHRPDLPELPISAIQKDPYADKPILSQRESKPDPNGNFSRLRIVKTSSKYPLVRVEEKLNKDFSTQEEHLVNRVAMVADHVLVRLDPRYSINDFQSYLLKSGFEILKAVPYSQIYIVKFDGQDIDAFDKALTKLKESYFIEDLGPDYIVRAN